MFYFIRNFERQKFKLRKAKENFYNVDADADISKWSWKTTESYLGTKIQAQKIESEHYSVALREMWANRDVFWSVFGLFSRSVEYS